jgi:hypothetical protein
VAHRRMDACSNQCALGIQDDMYARTVYAMAIFAPEHAAETLTAYYKIGAML